MAQHFTHLHVHTEYSLLDGAISIEKLVNFAKEDKLQAIGISDHGNIFGAVRFFQQCQKAGIKPILGMETYLTEDANIKDITNKYYHLLIIVENKIGYKNLCKLLAFAYTDGFYFKPRIDYKILEEYSEGLIVSSACMGGHLPALLMQERDEEAEKLLDWHLKLFGPEKYYLEIQPEDMAEQKILNEKIWELSKKKGLQVIATCDAHYARPEDHEAHEVMLSIQTRHKITDPDRMSFGDCRAYLRTTQEMLETFSAYPEAVWNTGTIADKCNFSFETGKLFFPQFEVPNEFNQEEYFRKICFEGLEKLINDERIDKNSIEIYKDRLTLEVDLIIKMGYVGYFLVVSDFIKWAKNNNIPVGPGRGSAAGSLVAWAIEITDVDPIKYNLLFERFLNPERISMPDIDIDFCIEGRDKVIEYVRQKYGYDKVCQIITFGTMMAKGVIKDVARVLGFPFEDSNALTDLISDQPKISLKEAIEVEPRLKRLIEGNAQVAKLFDLAFRLEGITRHASKHAAGIVISSQPVTDVLPVYVPPRTNELVAQYAMTELEYLGFLKMDFLGLKNLTLVQRVVDLIEKTHSIKLDLNKLPLDDPKTFELFGRGDTSGVFQLESDGIKDILIRLQPRTIEDIIAVNALYRPGPLGSGMVDDFIERKRGRKSIEYIFPELDIVLSETYGVIVYQEQVMKIASVIAGYSLAEADILRRAMGKKKAEEMAKQKSIFVTRAQAKNFDVKKAEELFDLMAYFAGYGFNKSHSTAYALIAYQTAYLKANFPVEFMACLISLEVSDSEKMASYIEQARNKGICVLAPDINSSSMYFDVIDRSKNVFKKSNELNNLLIKTDSNSKKDEEVKNKAQKGTALERNLERNIENSERKNEASENLLDENKLENNLKSELSDDSNKELSENVLIKEKNLENLKTGEKEKDKNSENSNNFIDKNFSYNLDNLIIRFGLQGVRNIGMATLEEILKERTKSGPFKDMLDLCIRLDLRTCNKRTLESLICSGACDSLPGNRAQKFKELSTIIDLALEKKQSLLTGQMGLFEMHDGNENKNEIQLYNYKTQEEWPDKIKLEKEKEILGVYLSAKPLDGYRKQLRWLNVNNFSSINAPNLNVTCCGIITSMRNITTKKGEPMAFVQCEDTISNAEIIVFPRLFSAISEWLKDYTIFVITGTTDLSVTGLPKIKAQQMIPLDLVLSEGTGLESLTAVLPDTYDQNIFKIIKEKIRPGDLRLSFIINENNTKVRVNSRAKVLFTKDLCEFLEQNNIDLQLGLQKPRERA